MKTNSTLILMIALSLLSATTSFAFPRGDKDGGPRRGKIIRTMIIR